MNNKAKEIYFKIKKNRFRELICNTKNITEKADKNA